MLSPDEIRSRTFLTTLRGYDREDVRAFLQTVGDELEALQAELAASAAEDAGPAPSGGADGLASEDATAEGADDATTRDESDATTLDEEVASDPGPAAGERATPGVDGAAEPGPFAGIGQETQRILEAAQSAGEELRRRAQEEADRELEAARTQATRLVAEAERHREEIQIVVETLEAARDELTQDLRGVGRSVERMLRDLAPAEPTTSPMRTALAEAVRDGPGSGAAVDEDPEPHDVDAATDVSAPEPPETPDGEGPTTIAAVVEPLRFAEAEPPAAGEPNGAQPPEVHAARAAPAVAPRLRAVAQPDPEPRAVARSAAWGVLERVPVRARGDALAPSHPKLVRRLKRGLQDIQNATLARLRRDGAKGEARAYLPEDSAVSGLADLARQHLANAYAVGYHSGASAVGQGAEDPPELERDLAGALAAEIVSAAADHLLEQLEAGVGEGAQLDGLSERVEAAFVAVRDGVVSQASVMALVRAYEWGQHDAWAAFGVEQRKWALAVEPLCGDPRCEDNAGSGAVPLGRPFPSGHEVPPARAGCSCTTVPLVPR